MNCIKIYTKSDGIKEYAEVSGMELGESTVTFFHPKAGGGTEFITLPLTEVLRITGYTK